VAIEQSKKAATPAPATKPQPTAKPAGK